jgi:hypothetical protein
MALPADSDVEHNIYVKLQVFETGNNTASVPIACTISLLWQKSQTPKCVTFKSCFINCWMRYKNCSSTHSTQPSSDYRNFQASPKLLLQLFIILIIMIAKQLNIHTLSTDDDGEFWLHKFRIPSTYMSG